MQRASETPLVRSGGCAAVILIVSHYRHPERLIIDILIIPHHGRSECLSLSASCIHLAYIRQRGRVGLQSSFGGRSAPPFRSIASAGGRRDPPEFCRTFSNFFAPIRLRESSFVGPTDSLIISRSREIPRDSDLLNSRKFPFTKIDQLYNCFWPFLGISLDVF